MNTRSDDGSVEVWRCAWSFIKSKRVGHISDSSSATFNLTSQIHLLPPPMKRVLLTLVPVGVRL